MVKGVISDSYDGVGDFDSLKLLAPCKGHRVYLYHRVRDCNFLDGGTLTEGAESNFSEGGRQFH